MIGGGNTAMDAARTAVRLVAAGGAVSLVYRRTLAQMPAAREELQAIQDEGVVIRELLAPARIEAREAAGWRWSASPCAWASPTPRDGRGRCPTSDGPRPWSATPSSPPWASSWRATCWPRGRPVDGGDPPGDHLPGVYVGGDALRGPATLVEAMGDGRRAARAMLDVLGLADLPAPERAPRRLADAAWQDRAARRVDPVLPSVRPATGPGDFDLVIGELSATEAQIEAQRCLDCSERCDVCVSVCPDRANLAYDVAARRWPLSRVVPTDRGHRLEEDGWFVVAQARQTANLTDFCNECGNCATFCPTAGAPYRDKPRLALSRAGYAAGDDVHLLTRRGDALTIRRRDAHGEESLTRRNGRLIYETAAVRVELAADTFAVTSAQFHDPGAGPLSLRPVAALAVLLDGLSRHPVVLTEED